MPVSKPQPLFVPATRTLLDSICRQAVLRFLSVFPKGELHILEPDGGVHIVGHGCFPASIEISDWRTYRMMVTGGAVGAAEAYMGGFWQTPDLTAVIRFFAANIEYTERLERGVPQVLAMLRQWAHLPDRDALTRARRNVAVHYDLGNDFFRLFLDDSMMYSSAVYPSAEASLEEAQAYKLDEICRKLALGPGVHLLETGTGWGGLAIHAARHYGCTVTTITISAQQYEFAKKRVEDAGLSDKIEVLNQDYRLLSGKYDRIVSIEMVEAVGEDNLAGYFRKLESLLKPDGLLLMQAITVPHQRYAQTRKRVDFIKKYIFPGGFLPSVNVLCEMLSANTSLRHVEVSDIGMHYAKTVSDWRIRFQSSARAMARMGFDEKFQRMWQYYLCYCEGAFLERAISTIQLLAEGPERRYGPVY